MIGIIDYGAGNLRSVFNAFKYIGEEARVCPTPADLEEADKVVFPGVGNGGDVITGLRSRGFDEAILESLDKEKPFLGICVGLQLLFESTEEAEGSECLGLIKGRVRLFPGGNGLKVPQIGWNSVSGLNGDCPLLKGIDEGTFFYFVHSYYCDSDEPDSTAAVTEYGLEYTSAVWRDNIYAVQFHPERSQEKGLKILENFAKL